MIALFTKVIPVFLGCDSCVNAPHILCSVVIYYLPEHYVDEFQASKGSTRHKKNQMHTIYNVMIVTYSRSPSARKMTAERGSRTVLSDGIQTCGHLQTTTTHIAPGVSTTSTLQAEYFKQQLTLVEPKTACSLHI